MIRFFQFFLAGLVMISQSAVAADFDGYLIKLKGEKNQEQKSSVVKSLTEMGATVHHLGIGGWVQVNTQNEKGRQLFDISTFANHPDVAIIQPNYLISLLEDYRVKDPAQRAQLEILYANAKARGELNVAPKADPEIPEITAQETGTGADPMFDKQWGMKDIGVKKAWTVTKGTETITVAVLDTGVDYTHEDLAGNMWRNQGETGVDENGNDMAKNGIDDDKNGFIDDVVGWDFAQKDSKPYDITLGLLDIVLKGGNPGHGTHCAGNVGAIEGNGKGIAGVAPNIKIMALRFITENGQGTTADAISSIKYAVDNGANVLSNSWGGEGEDDSSEENVALKEAFTYAEGKGVLSIVAAGNGRQGKGYNNDTDSKPVFPSTYDFKSIISVAAIDDKDNLGAFSNYGKRSVDIAAPGVKVMSTVPGNKYQDTIIDFLITATWDGTSMATPHVAGAAALYWSAHPDYTADQVKSAILQSAMPIASLKGKVSTDGKLDVNKLMNGNIDPSEMPDEDTTQPAPNPDQPSDKPDSPFPFPFPMPGE